MDRSLWICLALTFWSLLSTLSGVGGAPGPVCSGPCCSNNAPSLSASTPTMASQWWSNQMADGATVIQAYDGKYITSVPGTGYFYVLLDSYHTNTMIESHVYDVLSAGVFDKYTPQQEIAWVTNAQTGHLKWVNDLSWEGQVLMVGEWSGAMATSNGNDTNQRKFADAQIQAYSHARGGWFFWTWKMGVDGYYLWNWKMSINAGWVPSTVGTK